MSSVIKSADASAVATMHRRDQATGVPLRRKSEIELEIEARDARIAKLEAAIAQKERETRDLHSSLAEAFSKGEAQGIEKGRSAADKREEERLGAITAAITAQCKSFNQTLKNCETLAAVMALACLDKLFGDEDANAARVETLLRRQLDTLERGAVVGVEVSPQDFDEEALGELRARMGPRQVTLELASDLRSGGCRLTPRLGEIDIGLDTQWKSVRELLAAMAYEGAASC